MAHISEAEFQDQVVIPWIREQHPDAGIETNRYLDHVENGCYCDVWVDLGTHSLAMEVGNNDSTVGSEAQQAIEYADYSPTAIPVVMVPVGHTDPDVVSIWEGRGVLVWMLPAEGTD